MMADRLMQLWRRFRALDYGDRRLVVEAVVLLGAVQAGFRILPYATLIHVLSAAKRLPGSRRGPSRIGWAVAAAARLVPGRTCLSDALAADLMLWRRGYQCRLHLGVRRRDGAGPPEAHAWVELDGAIVTGDLPGLSEYRTFTGPKASAAG
jgi:Transglutaminase-like superfamily